MCFFWTGSAELVPTKTPLFFELVFHFLDFYRYWDVAVWPYGRKPVL